MSARKDPLRILEVIRRIEVGPVRVEPRRVRALYRIFRGRRVESLDLIYRFHEKVFDPKEPASLNLASMIVAQVAINYSQFCKEIVFHGLYDRHDRRFILDAMHNTAREIFVKKILEPNPFVIGAAASLPPIKRKSYRRAKVIFVDPLATSLKKLGPSWETDPNRFTVLSSGGKESLLSYCVLRETGHETHPVFVNESGRHWFTALNSYRHFAAKLPHTTRVWTNVDRVMCWIERRLSFVRPNFHDTPSDEYPIRLWTLPLFLFGVLPLARARKIGRIVIGDEYDTSRVFSHHGIPHYDGLYDQSRFFDNFMSRYYQKKGWGFTQFSIVRPVSELLVQKILVQRYPEIQRHQISCHAAHINNRRVKPCGSCEKCRRIVGMLMALGEDPSRCGYRQDQIRDALVALPGENFRQESAGAQQMAYMLSKKGLFPRSGPGSSGARPHPEILQLRLDRDHSPINAVPVGLREPLFRIFLRYSDGAVRMKRGKWSHFDLLKSPERRTAYPFD